MFFIQNISNTTLDPLMCLNQSVFLFRPLNAAEEHDENPGLAYNLGARMWN